LFSAAWSPDGKTILATGLHAGQLRGELVAMDVATGAERVLSTPDWRQVNRVAWLPDGTGLIVNAQESAAESSSQIFFVSYPSGEARRITSDLTSYLGLSLAPDGHSLVCIRNERRSNIWTQPEGDATKAAAVSIDAGADDGIHGMAWAPDGRIVFTTESNGNPDIWIMNSDGSRRIQLTSTPGQDISPRVTADGKYIVFVSDRDGGLRLWRMGLDGSGALRLSEDLVARGRGTLSADGKWIYYSEVSGPSRKVSIDGGASANVFTASAAELPPGFHEPMPSPDGQSIAGHYSETSGTGERIAVLPASGGPAKLFPTVPPSGSWTADSQAFIYIDTKAGVSNLMRQPIAGGAPAALTKFTSERIFDYAVVANPPRIGLVRGSVVSDVVLISTAKK
jgi:hypothetical protein